MGRAAEAGIRAAIGHYARIEFKDGHTVEGPVARIHNLKGYHVGHVTVFERDAPEIAGIIIAGMERDS